MPLAIGDSIPTYPQATIWLSEEAKAVNRKHGPVLVQFWAVSCPICKINMPKLHQFLNTYHDQGLQLVSIHMPRMESDMNVEKVKAIAEELGLTGPCAIDNDHTLGDRFQTGGVWPTYFLFDAEGKLRSRAAGSLGIKMAENSLRRLSKLQGAA